MTKHPPSVRNGAAGEWGTHAHARNRDQRSEAGEQQWEV